MERPNELLPNWLFFCLALVALALPNLIFSGSSFFDTLHVMKWVFAMGPIAVMAIVGGLLLLIYGARGGRLKLDPFSKLWLAMLLYVTAQPLWTDITSRSTFIKEWFFFATVVGMYIFSFNARFSAGWHKLILWGANVNAALNVLFAELLMRKMNDGIIFIMNVPDNYIGNTGQQEMFGLWMAMALINGFYLHVAGVRDSRPATALKVANLALVAVNAWGLWNSTTRGAFFSLLVGTVILTLLIWRCLRDRQMLRRAAHISVAIIAMLLLTLAAGRIFEFGRAAALVSKTSDMLTNASSIGGRRGIWQTSMAMVRDHALMGVGIGHYKWHYLAAQQKALQQHPENDWVYTFWAHSEYIQWFAEFGLFGILFLTVVGGWWLWRFVRALVQRQALSLEAVWAASMLFLIMFDALFSRPFHRIENILWAPFAFAMINREILQADCRDLAVKSGELCRVFGLAILCVAAAGLLFLGSGIRADKLIRNSMQTKDVKLQSYRLHEAMKHTMMRDEAQEQYAYHLIYLARTTKKEEDWDRAILQLYRSFKIRPNGRQLIDLVNLSRQLEYSDILKEILPLVQRPPLAADRPQPGAPRYD